MSTYADRFVAALSTALPGFTVENHQDRIVAYLDGVRALSNFVPDVDKRNPVTPDDLSRWINGAYGQLRRDVYHYTPKAKADVAPALAVLAESPWIVR